MNLQTRILASGFVLCALLTACGGGGGTGGGTPATNPPATPTPCPAGDTGTPPNCVAPTTTNASGTVVNDANGSALAGVTVVLEPWTAGATPLPAPQATTDASGNFTLANAPNGHYLLVIGNDTPGQTATAVVHDNVTLTGGTQSLKAPTLPTIPGYTAPAWETNGDYRIASLDATNEVPCFTAWNNDRAAHSLTKAVPDEWLQESTRAQWSFSANGSSGSRPANNGYLTGNNAGGGGGGTCQSAYVDPVFAGAVGTSTQNEALSSSTLWLGANWKQFTFNNSTQFAGTAQFPYDPRFQADISGLSWP